MTKSLIGAMTLTPSGVYPEKCGTLYNLQFDGTLRRHFNSLTIPNGLAWDPKYNKFYFIDSPTRRVEQFDYDPESNIISKY